MLHLPPPRRRGGLTIDEAEDVMARRVVFVPLLLGRARLLLDKHALPDGADHLPLPLPLDGLDVEG